MKVTIALSNDEVYRRVKVRAAASQRQIRDVVEEALEAWLDAQEDAEDRVASEAALKEHTATGGVDADAYFQRLIAEGRVTYEPG